jgi:hypothetical protein
MYAYATNQKQFPIVGFRDIPKVGQAVPVLVEKSDYKGHQGEEQFDRYGHVFLVTAVDVEAMTVELDEMRTNPLFDMNRPLVHGEQRNDWGKTELNLLEAREAQQKEKEAASNE